MRSFLEEPARSVIAGLPLTDADYNAAIDISQKRYAKPSIIKRAHMNEMLDLSPVYNERSIVRLRTLHGQIESHFRSLDALRIGQECYLAIVVPVLMEKIPESLHYNMIRFSDASSHLYWNVKELIDAFEKELQIRESHVPIFGPQQHPQQHPQQQHHPRKHKNSMEEQQQLCSTAKRMRPNAYFAKGITRVKTAAKIL